MTKIEKKPEVLEALFTTRDIYLASTLITMNFRLVGIDYQYEGERKRPIGYFNFEESNDLREAEREYWSGQLAVEPRFFITNLKGLKAQAEGTYKRPNLM
jgi:hypothetical protein